MLKKKVIEEIVKAQGLKFKDWQEKTILKGRMAIIDKQGTEYKEWENELVEREALKLLSEQYETKSVKTKQESNDKKEEQKLFN